MYDMQRVIQLKKLMLLDWSLKCLEIFLAIENNDGWSVKTLTNFMAAQKEHLRALCAGMTMTK